MEEGITAHTNYAVLMRQRGSQKVSIVLGYVTKKTAMATAHNLNTGTDRGDWVYWATNDWDEEKYAESLSEISSLNAGSLALGTLKVGKVNDSVRRW